MLKAINALGAGARLVTTVITSSLPILIIGVLLYAAFFIKWEPEIAQLKAPPIERRDVFYGVVSPAPSVVWAVGSYGKVVRSDDGGESWSVQANPLAAHLQAVAAWDARSAVAVGNGGVVIVTSDGGKTWKPVDAPRSEIANKLMQVRAYPGGLAWAVGEVGAVLKSTDYGATWVRVVPEKDQAWNDIFFLGQDGWMVGEFGQMQRTEDGGATWAAISSPVESSLMSVYFRDPLDGVAVGLSGVVLVTADGGTTWAQAPAMTREHLNSVIWDGSHWVAVGDKGMRVVGDADGTHWSGGRISEQDLAWRTQILKVDSRLFLAGAHLSVLDGQHLRTFGRD